MRGNKPRLVIAVILTVALYLFVRSVPLTFEAETGRMMIRIEYQRMAKRVSNSTELITP